MGLGPVPLKAVVGCCFTRALSSRFKGVRMRFLTLGLQSLESAVDKPLDIKMVLSIGGLKRDSWPFKRALSGPGYGNIV